MTRDRHRYDMTVACVRLFITYKCSNNKQTENTYDHIKYNFIFSSYDTQSKANRL